MSSSVRRPPRRREPEEALSSSLLELPGIGDKRQVLLGELGIKTIGDLMAYPPIRYIDRTTFSPIAALRAGEVGTATGKVVKFEDRPTRGKRLSIAHLEDPSGRMRCMWFNQPYLKRVFTPGAVFVVSGTVRADSHGLAMVHPEYEQVESEAASGLDADVRLVHTGRIVPVYRTRPGLGQKQFRATVQSALDRYAGEVRDPLPPRVKQDLALTDLEDAVRDIHFPPVLDRAEVARRRLAFDELLVFQTLFALARKAKRGPGGGSSESPGAGDAVARLASGLPFQLTASQQAALGDILGDLGAASAMRRLLQGDVGCGKTVVAGLAIAQVCASGNQAALLCPTEILSEQHFATLKKFLGPLGLKVGLVTGGLDPRERRAVERAMALGEIDLAVGTHALVGEKIAFKRLGLVVVDEEQRFGVWQRTKLVRDVPRAHLLVVSATPIPRTLALTAYGDLDVTVIGQMPPGRGRHTTRLVDEHRRLEVLKEVAGSINAGRQGFYVCPALEEGSTDLMDVGRAKKGIERLLAPHRGVEVLTGRTPRAKRAAILEGFLANRIGLVVATTVLEVGMDIPSATILVVEQAERFGLSQLHQMRGRVARTGDASFSYLLVSDSASAKALKRLKVLETTFDGFDVAEQDLMLRGPGDIVGERQHGIPDLRFAALPDDLDLMLRARDEAFGFVLGPSAAPEWDRWLAIVEGLVKRAGPVL
jgi:ATP-dependent DNA helicase RecG